MLNKKAISLLAGMMSIRMLGLFMILPVFSVAAEHLSGATPKLMGLALGIYGLTQACLQIPLGFLSDHIGRKRVIFAGLSLFFLGSVLGATAHSIDVMIVARALQGAGAIGSTILAFVADLTSTEQRTKAMATIGMSIGFAFTLAMIVGPIVNHFAGLSGIFCLTAILALIAMGFLFCTPKQPKAHHDFFEKKYTLKNLMLPTLLKLDLSIFSLHAILTSMFIAIPILLTKQFHFTNPEQMSLYGGVLILGFACAIPLIIIAEKQKKITQIFTLAITMILLVEACFIFFNGDAMIACILLFIFFIAFTALEALLPSLVSKTVAPQNKGAAMGVYSSSQFLGIFVGGALGGVILSHFNMLGIFVFCTVLAGVWLMTARIHLRSCP